MNKKLFKFFSRFTGSLCNFTYWLNRKCLNFHWSKIVPKTLDEEWEHVGIMLSRTPTYYIYSYYTGEDKNF